MSNKKTNSKHRKNSENEIKIQTRIANDKLNKFVFSNNLIYSNFILCIKIYSCFTYNVNIKLTALKCYKLIYFILITFHVCMLVDEVILQYCEQMPFYLRWFNVECIRLLITIILTVIKMKR